MTGGMITTVPTTADEAKKMGEDLIKKKGGEFLSKVSGSDVLNCICVHKRLQHAYHAHAHA